MADYNFTSALSSYSSIGNDASTVRSATYFPMDASEENQKKDYSFDTYSLTSDTTVESAYDRYTKLRSEGLFNDETIVSATDYTSSYNTSISSKMGKGFSEYAKAPSQVTTSLASKNAFSFVERALHPDMFAYPESCLIFFTKSPLMSKVSSSEGLPLIGMADSFNFSIQQNVFTAKELGSRRNIIIPLKQSPGSLSLNRVVGNFPSILGMVTGRKNIITDFQNKTVCSLFGMGLIFMDMTRSTVFSTIFFEKCAFINDSISIMAGNPKVMETATIMFDRARDTRESTEV
jgi:hypothetical protein